MEKSIYRVYIFVLVFAPLAFGAVEQWSLSVMETASLALLALFIYRRAKRTEPFVREIPGLLPLSLLLVYPLLQLVPLPASVIRVVSPGTYALYETAAWTGRAPQWLPLSVSPKATMLEFFRLSSYGAFYVLTVQLLAKKELLKKTAAFLAVFGAALAFFSIIQHILWNDRIYWIRRLTGGGSPFGPYVNHNHYAGLMEMIFPSVLSMFLYYKPVTVYGSFRERISAVFDQRLTNFHILLGFACVLMATSVFLSLSRGGIVGMCLSTAALGGMLLVREKKRGRGKIIFPVVILIVVSVGWFGWAPVFERFGRVRSEIEGASALRPQMWGDSMKIIGDFPAVGSGFGSFVHIYPKYRSISFPGILDHAHNDYLEFLAEGGFVGMILFGWFLAEVLLKSFRAFIRRREPYSIYAFAGAFAGIFAILLHSFVDFNLHIGANGLYFFFLTGLAVSAANTRLREGLDETSLGRRGRPFVKKLRVVSLVLLCSGAVFTSGALLGTAFSLSAPVLSAGPAPDKEELERTRDLQRRAARFDPLDAGHLYAAANAEWRLGDSGAAMDDYRKAIRLEPADAEYTQMLGFLASESGAGGNAEAIIRAGIALDPTNPLMYKRCASWLFAAGKMQEGMEMVKEAVSLDPLHTREYITLMVLYGISDGQAQAALPGRAEAHRLFADYLAQTGNETMAEAEYMRALDLVKGEKEVNPWFFYGIRRYYDDKQRYDEALMVMTRALELLPRDAGIHIAAGDAYEKAGITYRAVEEYRKALLLDPGNVAAGKRLDALRS